MPTITPFLWFDGKAEEAAGFYCSIFPDAVVLDTTRAGGGVLTMTIALLGQKLILLNGGPTYRFTPAVSLFVSCETQAEVDHAWDRLADGGTPMRCGWLTDRYGLTWQIVPTELKILLADADPARSSRVMTAMLAMARLDLPTLRRAYDG